MGRAAPINMEKTVPTPMSALSAVVANLNSPLNVSLSSSSLTSLTSSEGSLLLKLVFISIYMCLVFKQFFSF